MTSSDFKMIEVSDQDTPTTTEIVNSSNSEIISKPEDSLPFKNAASPASPTHARHHDQLFFERRANFGDSHYSESSSPFTDIEAIYYPSDPLPLHFTTQFADEMVCRPRLGPGDIMASETMKSCYDDAFLANDSSDEHYPIVELGRNSAGSSLEDPWADPPVSYAPASWPTGPRDLPTGRYICPYKGCEHLVDLKESDEGYSRKTLGPHIQSHPVPFSTCDIKCTVRERVKTLHCAQHRNPDDIAEDEVLGYYSDDPDGTQRETDQLILDLEELKNWERSSRFADAFPLRPMSNDDRMRYNYLRREKGNQETMTAAVEAAEDADDESVPHQNSNRFRNNRFRRHVNPPSLGYPPQELPMGSDSSFGPPRKKARKSRPQLDRSCNDFVPPVSDDLMELD